MARCLVTGHKGYIGSSVYEQLKNMGHEVMGIDLKEGKDILRELKPDSDGKFHPHWAAFRPEYIFHLAAMPRVSYSVEHPVEVIENNLLYTGVRASRRGPTGDLFKLLRGRRRREWPRESIRGIKINARKLMFCLV